jgi:hypothetical protein
MKPWGMLLGDEITGTRKSKIYMKLERLGTKFKDPAPLKPPTLE